MHRDCFESVTEAGFSFLELVISLVLLSLLTLALMWSLHIGIQTWDKATKDQDAQADVYFAQNALRLFLSSAHLDANAQTSTRIAFEGSNDGLVLLARMPEQFGYGGDYKVAIEARRRPDNQFDLVLLFSLYPPIAGEQTRSKQSETVVLPNIKTLAFRYFGALTETQSPDWSPHWSDRSKLPKLISVDVTFPEASKRFWPTLLVVPRLSGNLLQ